MSKKYWMIAGSLMAASTIIGAALDQYKDSDPLFSMLGVAAGLMIMAFIYYKQGKESMKD